MSSSNTNADVAWVLFPVLFGFLAYYALALLAWPYMRPRAPFGLLILAVLFPPLLPLAILYIFLIPRVVAERTLVVVDPSTRGRVVAITRVAPPVRVMRAGSSRV